MFPWAGLPRKLEGHSQSSSVLVVRAAGLESARDCSRGIFLPSTAFAARRRAFAPSASLTLTLLADLPEFLPQAEHQDRMNDQVAEVPVKLVALHQAVGDLVP